MNSNHQYAAGEVIALSKSYASLQFESMLEIVELPIQKFLECLFVKKVPLGSVVFSARDFVVADLDEFLLRSSKCVRFMAEMKSQGAVIDSSFESLDLYSESCSQTRSKRLKHCLLKFLDEPPIKSICC